MRRRQQPSSAASVYADQAAPETWLPQPQLTAFHQALHALSTEITEHIRNQGLEVQGHRSFTAYSSRSSRPRYKSDHPSACQRSDPDGLRALWELDMQLFPIEMMAGLREKDIIETIRISPRDAQKGFSRSGFSDKVAGDALYHFRVLQALLALQ